VINEGDYIPVERLYHSRRPFQKHCCENLKYRTTNYVSLYMSAFIAHHEPDSMVYSST